MRGKFSLFMVLAGIFLILVNDDFEEGRLSISGFPPK